MGKTNETPDFLRIAENIKEKVSQIIGTEAPKFFKQSFVKEGWTGDGFQKWPARISPLGGKRILYRQGRLRDSIYTSEQNKKRVVVLADSDYAEIHNEGGTVTVTKQMKKFWWAKYYEFGGKIKPGKTKADRQRNETINAKAQYCKNMALMKAGSKIRIPKRQFIGESAALNKLIQGKITDMILKEFKR
jgi:phage gpG-like protein